MKHDLTGNELYLKEQSRINHQHPAKYAFYCFIWLMILLSIVSLVNQEIDMIKFILRFFKKDAQSMLNGGLKNSHFYDAENRNICGWY